MLVLKSLGSGNGLAPLFWFGSFLCVAALCEQTLDLLVNAPGKYGELTRMGLRCTVLAGDEPILGLGSSRVSEQSGTGATKVACKAYGLDLQVNPVDG